MQYYDINEIDRFDQRKRAHFINSLSGYKSANLIGTKDNSGHTNLSIVSSAVHLGANPALISIIFRPDIAPRHTLDNIRETKYCTLNHISQEILEQAHQTSARYPKEMSEFHACNLTEEYLENFSAPFVKESKLKMALELVREIPIQENGTHFVIFAIKGVHLPSEVLQDDGYIDLEKIQSVSVSGLDGYNLPKSLGRLSYAKTDKSPTWLD